MKYKKRLIPFDPDTLECGTCHERKSRDEFSHKQLTKKSNTPPRCRVCVSKNARHNANRPANPLRYRQLEHRYKKYYQQGFIYFVRDIHYTGRIKIGYTADLRSRIRNVQSHSPVPLELMTYIPGNRTDEAELHQRFSGAHSHFEWYEPTTELIEFIEGLAALQQGLVFPVGKIPIAFIEDE